MNIQLKRLHAIFCLDMIPERDHWKNYPLMLQLKAIRAGYDGEDEETGNELVTIDIPGETLAGAWHNMSQQQEGLTAPISREMVEGSEGFTGFEIQLAPLVQVGDPEALIVYEKMMFLRANFKQQRKDKIKANLNYLDTNFL